MLDAGDEAPGFELPAVVGDTLQHQTLSQYLGEEVVVLAFYPADFNPACDEDGCGLDELDLFTMQKDVTILGVSPDSVYSHRQFADRYDLKVPLLSDTRRELAEAYGVGMDSEQGYLVKRAVFVIDLHGIIQYSWATDKPQELPNVEPIRAAISAVGGDSTAVSRYKVGHAHYVEGRRAFTAAMNAFSDHEWMNSRKDFDRAQAEFEEAADEFDTALRFSDAPVLNGPFEQARLKANSLWQAADWLADASDAYSSGNGSVGEEYRKDAETPLNSARKLDEPIDPRDINVADDEVTLDIEEETSIMEAIRERQAETEAEEDLTVAEIDPETGEESPQLEPDGPETDAARRIREYGEEGEMGQADGAGEDQIADAVSEIVPEDEQEETVEDSRTPEMELDDGTDDEDEDVTDEEVAEIAAELEQQEQVPVEEEEDVTDEEVAEIAAELEQQDQGP